MLRALKNPWLLAGAALVVVLVVVALRPQAVPVETAPVARGALEVTVDEEGETRVRRRFVVSAPVHGQVLRIELEPGDTVARGAAVATIRPGVATLLDARERAEAQARLQAAEATVGRARADLQRARAAADHAAAEARRARELLDAKVIAPQELDARESQARIAAEEHAAAEFALQAAQQEVAAMRARLTQSGAPPAGAPVTVRAPIDGVVLRRLRESESTVAAGEPLLELGDPDDLEIVADLLSTDAVRVRPGAAVRIEEWGGDEPIRGTVRRVEPSGFTKISALGVEEQRVNVIIDVDGPGEATRALGDAYRVEVRIVLARRDDALIVPSSSLFRTGDEFAVFVVDEERARRRGVQVGARTGLQAEIVSGLAEGERVIVHPPDTLEDGMVVVVR